MKSGDLRECVEILAPVEVQKASGYVTQSLQHLADMPAKISSVSGKDFFSAYAAGAADILTVSIRWLDGLTTSHAVSWQGVIYEIVEINYLGVKRDFMTLKLKVKSGTAGGH